MKVFFAVILSVFMLMAVNVSCSKSTSTGSESPDKPVSLETQSQKASYIMGYSQGRNMKMRQLDEEVDLDILMQGIKDGIKGEGKIQEKDFQTIMQEFQKGFQERQDAKRSIQGEKNKAEGEKFLQENKQKPDIHVTGSGLQYLVLKEGTGPKPQYNSVVEVHYTGTLIDGTEFDSSVKRGVPAKFPLNGVIPGWTEGVQLMSVGSKYKFFIPSDLAYGPSGQGLIGPNAVLIFEVELISIQPPKEEMKPGESKPIQLK